MSNRKRFLEDCEILLENEEITSEGLLEIFNSIFPLIQFTAEVSENC